MRRPWLHRVFLAVLPAAFLLPASAGDDESREPPLRLRLATPQGQREVALDQPFELAIGAEKVQVTLTALPTKRLSVAHIAFEYPRHMPFQYEKGEVLTSWTLDGNDVVISLHRYAVADMPLHTLENAIAGRLRVPPRNRSDIELNAGGTKLAGRRLLAEIAGARLAHELFVLPGRGDGTWVLTLQDSLGDGEGTEEMAAVRRLLQTTLELDG